MPEHKPSPYDDTPNGIWESVFVTRPGGTPYKDGHYERQCKVCHNEFPDHKLDCEYNVLSELLERAAPFVEAIKDAPLTDDAWARRARAWLSELRNAV